MEAMYTDLRKFCKKKNDAAKKKNLTAIYNKKYHDIYEICWVHQEIP